MAPIDDPAARAVSETQKREIVLDLAQLTLDITGIVDPTPVSDGTNMLISLARGRWTDAAISAISLVPYLGDAAKVAKLDRYLNTLQLAKEIAKTDYTWRRALRPMFARLKPLLDALREAGGKDMAKRERHWVNRLRQEVDEFLGLPPPGRSVAPQQTASATQGRKAIRTMGPTDEEPVELIEVVTPSQLKAQLKGAGDGGTIAEGKVVPDKVESFSTNAAFDGKLYPDKKIDQLVPYLEKRGVTVMETRGNPSFTGNWDGTGVMRLPANPTELQVKHELSHFIDFRNQIKQAPTVREGVQNYVDMGRLGREQSVLDHLQNNRVWNQLNDAERSFSIDYVERLRMEAGQ